MNATEHITAETFDELIEFGSQADRKAELIESKSYFFRQTGEVFEDDKQFETRMLAFLNWYLLDRRSDGCGRTPAQELYCAYVQRGVSEKARRLRGYTETVHSLFQVKKISGNRLNLADVFTEDGFWVTERRQIRGIETGDVVEARLIPQEAQWFLSKAICFHPHKAVPLILRKAKTVAKETALSSKTAFVFECAKRSLKADRYRQISVEKIYDFSLK